MWDVPQGSCLCPPLFSGLGPSPLEDPHLSPSSLTAPICLQLCFSPEPRVQGLLDIPALNGWCLTLWEGSPLCQALGTCLADQASPDSVRSPHHSSIFLIMSYAVSDYSFAEFLAFAKSSSCSSSSDFRPSLPLLMARVSDLLSISIQQLSMKHRGLHCG